jgi:hypothetical protein
MRASSCNVPPNLNSSRALNPNWRQVCMLYSSGELHVVEYGINEAVLSLRTEHMSPYLLSVAVQVRPRGRRRMAGRAARCACTHARWALVERQPGVRRLSSL